MNKNLALDVSKMTCAYGVARGRRTDAKRLWGSSEAWSSAESSAIDALPLACARFPQVAPRCSAANLETNIAPLSPAAPRSGIRLPNTRSNEDDRPGSGPFGGSCVLCKNYMALHGHLFSIAIR